VIDKSEAARKQIECAIRLVAAREDDIAVHTLAMAAFGILNDLAASCTIEYDLLFRPLFTEIGWSHLTSTANFLKHADRDPEAILASPDPRENHWWDWLLPSSLPLGTGHSDAYNGRVPQLDGYPSS
jgi:hypothetical protein